MSAHNTQSYSPYEKVTRGDRKTTGVADHRNPLLSHANRLGDGKLFLDSFNDQAARWISAACQQKQPRRHGHLYPEMTEEQIKSVARC